MEEEAMKSKSVLMALGLILVLFSYSFAQVPQMINYQGKLTKASGAPLDTTIQMIFTIYADSDGITSLWTETQTAVAVQKGVFNVLLGSVAPISFATFDGSVRYLGVKVGGDPEITPRKAMVSVPYAMRTVGGGGGSDNDWAYRITDTADTSLVTGGAWGIARAGNVLYGNADSTHVNLGVASTTGTSGQNNKYCTVGGGAGNTAGAYYSTVGGGLTNTADGTRSTVGGGNSNIASGYASTVAGGESNLADALNATVSGGRNNQAVFPGATVGGGQDNLASDTFAVVNGGVANTADGWAATVGGGGENSASGTYYPTVAGGRDNTASGDYYSTVSGGTKNTAGGDGSVVAGGDSNTVTSTMGAIGGGQMNYVQAHLSGIPFGEFDTIITSGAHSVLFGIGSKLTQDSTFMVDMPHIWFGKEATGYEFPASRGTNGQVIQTDANGKLSWGTVSSGADADWTVDASDGDTTLFTGGRWGIARYGNILYGNADSTHVNLGVACTTGTNGQNFGFTTVGGGKGNAARGPYATVGGGNGNTASGGTSGHATVGGGYSNSAEGIYSFVGGGVTNSARGNYSSVVGGESNITLAGASFSTVGGGIGDTAAGWGATVPGGYFNKAVEFSFAAGKRAKAIHAGTFVWADSSNEDFASTGVEQFLIRASGGVGIGKNNPAQALDVNGTAQMTGFKLPTGAAAGRVLTSDASGNGTWQATATDNDWSVDASDGDTTLFTGGRWGIARYGNILYGNGDSTHVNLGVACTTGTSGQNWKYSTVGGGLKNAAKGEKAIVGGGYGNTASGPSSTVGGGWQNTATVDEATVAGGGGNDATGGAATVAGGDGNTASGLYATVGGGSGNTASGWAATVAGGYYSFATDTSATVGGGLFNLADGIYATVGGGVYDTAIGNYATVPGGRGNLAYGNYSFAAGRRAHAIHTGSFVWADGQDADFASTNTNQFMIRAANGVGINKAPAYTLDVNGTAQMTGFKLPTGAAAGRVLTSDASGVGTWQATATDIDWTVDASDGDTTLFTGGPWGIARYGNILYGTADSTHVNLGVACTTGTSGQNYGYATVGGGRGNAAIGLYGTVGGGSGNTAGYRGTVGGGLNNEANGSTATVGGGSDNHASANRATVAGGYANSVTGDYGTAGGGYYNITSSTYATVGGGYYDTASGQYATVPGGYANKALGNYSFAAGRRAKAIHLGSFVWADSSTDADFASTANNQFLIRANRVGINTNSPSYTLDVNGDINVSGNVRKSGGAYTWPDYVFEAEYKLLPFHELRKYISEKKCLPGVISADEIKKNQGYKMDEVLVQMLEKIEEQSLYILQLEERITELEKKGQQK